MLSRGMLQLASFTYNMNIGPWAAALSYDTVETASQPAGISSLSWSHLLFTSHQSLQMPSGRVSDSFDSANIVDVLNDRTRTEGELQRVSLTTPNGMGIC